MLDTYFFVEIWSVREQKWVLHHTCYFCRLKNKIINRIRNTLSRFGLQLPQLPHLPYQPHLPRVIIDLILTYVEACPFDTVVYQGQDCDDWDRYPLQIPGEHYFHSINGRSSPLVTMYHTGYVHDTIPPLSIAIPCEDLKDPCPQLVQIAQKMFDYKYDDHYGWNIFGHTLQQIINHLNSKTNHKGISHPDITAFVDKLEIFANTRTLSFDQVRVSFFTTC